MRTFRSRKFWPRFSILIWVALPLMTIGNVTAWAQFVTGQSRGIAGTVKLKGKATIEQRIEVTLLSSDRRPVDHSFTDSLGSFQFLGIGAGQYIIVIDEPGYQRLEDTVEIPPRSQSVQRRYYLLEPKGSSSTAPADTSPVSAQKFQVPKEAREFFEKGERQLSRRQYHEAAEDFDRALAIAPNFADALSDRALIYMQENNLTKARELYKEAIASNPQMGDALIGLGSVLNREGNSEAALEPLTKGLALKPNSYLGHFESCRAYLNLGRLEPAADECKRAKKLTEGSRPELHILMGNLFLRQGRKSEALSEFEAYLRLDSSSATAAQVRSVVKSLQDAGVGSPK